MKNRRILFVDDEPLLLDNYRELFSGYPVTTASSGFEALRLLQSIGPHAVIISDLSMPEMDGIEFLARARAVHPESVRLMLTAHADTQAAIRAVNEGRIFRFLTKPASYEDLLQAIEAALTHYGIAEAERELLEQTLSGSVRLLAEVLSLVNPGAFGRAARIRRAMRHMAAELRLENAWTYEMAGLLSQIGCIALSPEVLSKLWAGQPLDADEQLIASHHPDVGRALLENIPRLEPVARMIARQEGRTGARPDDRPEQEAEPEDPAVVLGGEMLRTALAVDQLLALGIPFRDAVASLRRQPGRFPARLTEALATCPWETPPVIRAVRVHQLDTSMVLDEDVFGLNGMLLVAGGHEVTVPVILRLRGFARGVGVREPFRVRVPGENSADARRAA